MIQDNLLYASSVQASQALITHILDAMEKEPERPFTIALSGGNTPAVLFEVWEREYAAYTPWTRIYFYWVDERCVPPTNDQSNFGLAYRLLFNKIKLPPMHYYRIVGEAAPEEEAILYSSLVKATVPTAGDVPVFDFVLLGIGEDGHTSSIFPDRRDLLTAEEPYAVSVNPYNKSIRICMTGRPMIEAKHTCFLVTGKNKCSILNRILNKDKMDIYPASYVWHHARNPQLYASL
ncbi:6-phosphogluconolactonase [Phocaeicola sp.]